MSAKTAEERTTAVASERKRAPRLLLRLVGLIGSILAIVCVVGGALIAFNASPPRSNASHHVIEIQEGEPFITVARTLHRHRVVRSALLFRIIGRLSGEEHSVQSGTFHIPAGLNSHQVLAHITTNNQILERITVPEGYTIRKIGALLEERGVTTLADFRQAASDPDTLERYTIAAPSAEGFLYPDTYFFSRNYSAERVVEHMIERFYRALKEVYPHYHTLSPETLHTKIIIASLVEKEYVDPEEASLISSVFYNRLSIGMPLQSDATVVYIITEELSMPHPQQLFYRDLELSSPYNTYLHNTLPPTPIANPGATALRASFMPVESDYIYFVLKGPDAKHHHFSQTIAEHARATVFYLRRY